MPLTEEAGLRAYAKMINTFNVDCLEYLLVDDFIYESQYVFSALESKKEFIDYIRGKLMTIQREESTVFAEMGTVMLWGERPCVIVAQDDKDDLVGLVLAEVTGDQLKRLDFCMIPTSQSAQRSGEYPA